MACAPYSDDLLDDKLTVTSSSGDFAEQATSDNFI